MKSKIKFFLFLTIGIFIFKWIYDVFAGENALRIILENVNYFYFILLAHIPTLYFDALTWVVLCKGKRLSISWSMLIIWISQATGKFFPTGNITGEFVRIFLAVKKGLPVSQASSTVFIDLILATFSLFLIACISLIYFLFSTQNFIINDYLMYLIFSLSLLFVSCVIFYFLIKKRSLKFLLRKIPHISSFKLSQKKIITLVRLEKALLDLTQNKNLLFKALLFRLLGWLGGAFEIYIFLLIIGFEPKVIDVIIIESFSGIIRAVAFFIPAGIGIQELAFIIVGDFVGLNPEISFTIAIGRRIREVLVGLPAIITWILMNKNFKK